MKRTILKMLIIVFALYVILCGGLYMFQEKLIFFPKKLDKNFQFNFGQKIEEINIKTEDNKLLNAILFKADNSKGLIFYLHGNAGSLSSWAEVAKSYTDLSYDVFIMDYRGYGKSESSITSEEQLFQDVQLAYNEAKKRCPEDKMIVLGYSIGTGPATKVASVNNPKLLILQAPYYSLTDMMKYSYPIVPTFLLKYKLETNKYIRGCKMPIVIFHGDSDEVIYYGSSLKLSKIMKKNDRLITLNGQAHNGMTDNLDYITEIKKILAQ